MTHPLVTTTWLDQHLKDRDLRIIDIRGHVTPASEPPPHYFSHREAYMESHIPGAVFVDWVRDISVNGPTNTQVAPPEKFAELMGKLGVNEKTFVVAYDDACSMFAARLWWALNYYGHSRVAVLDGGWDMWIAEDRPTSKEVPYAVPTTFTPKIQPEWRLTAEEVASKLHTNTRLIDARTIGEFKGESSRAKRFGHIPGAENIPRTDLVAPDSTMLPAGVLQDKFSAMNLDGDQEIITYCNGGVSASFALLALKVAGLNGAIYDGSWKDWGNRDEFPIEK